MVKSCYGKSRVRMIMLAAAAQPRAFPQWKFHREAIPAPVSRLRSLRRRKRNYGPPISRPLVLVFV